MDGEGHCRGVQLMLPIANRGRVWNIPCTRPVMGIPVPGILAQTGARSNLSVPMGIDRISDLAQPLVLVKAV